MYHDDTPEELREMPKFPQIWLFYYRDYIVDKCCTDIVEDDGLVIYSSQTLSREPACMHFPLH